MKLNHVDVAEIAKLVRKHLRAEFPAEKFSVRSSRYAGGASIDVSWADGPTEKQVDKVVNGFRGARFEGRSDCRYGAKSWYCPEHGARAAETYGCDIDSNNGPQESRCCHRAELFHSGADYVHTQRTLSPEFEAELQDRVARRMGRSYDPLHHDGIEWMSTYVYRESVETARLATVLPNK